MIPKIYQKNSLFWGDGWILEGNQAWFVSGIYSAIFEVDIRTKKARVLSELPVGYEFSFRWTPVIYKDGPKLYLLPDYSPELLVFDMINRSFTKIPFHKNKERINAYISWKIDNELWVWCRGIQEIICVNLDKETISKRKKFNTEKGVSVAGVELYNRTFYGIGSDGDIYSISVDNNESSRIEIKNKVENGGYFFRYGDRFWIIGNYRSIYSWAIGVNEILSYDSFPNEFGIYIDDIIDTKTFFYKVPAFSNYKCIKDMIWFCPLQTNEIIWLDIKTNEIKSYKLFNESTDVLSNYMSAVGLFQYVRDDRYLGVFDYSQMKLIEIDTETLTHQIVNYELDTLGLKDAVSRKYYCEGNDIEEFMYWKKIGL